MQLWRLTCHYYTKTSPFRRQSQAKYGYSWCLVVQSCNNRSQMPEICDVCIKKGYPTDTTIVYSELLVLSCAQRERFCWCGRSIEPPVVNSLSISSAFSRADSGVGIREYYAPTPSSAALCFMSYLREIYSTCIKHYPTRTCAMSCASLVASVWNKYNRETF